MKEKLIELAKHILAMKDDAHFQEHPEWIEIVNEAEATLNSEEGNKQ